MIRHCKHCKKNKEWHQSGRTGRCKDCHNKRGRDYKKNRRETLNQRRSESRKMIRELINGYKESKGCAECKTWHPHYLLDFDHLDGGTKSGTISRMITEQISINKIMIEIQKCEVVCKNHHAERTHKRRLSLT
jgi:hypothetical protein